MNFILRYCLGFNLLLLIKLFVCTTVITSFGFLHVNKENATLFIMPVSTRSQARLSTISLLTGTRVLSTTCSTGIRVLSEAILQHHSPNTLSDTSNFQYLPSHITPTSSTTSHDVDHCCCPSHSCSDTFQTLTFEKFVLSSQFQILLYGRLWYHSVHNFQSWKLTARIVLRTKKCLGRPWISQIFLLCSRTRLLIRIMPFKSIL